MEEDMIKAEQLQQSKTEETKTMTSSPRKSVREKRRRQSFSPDPLRSSGKKSKPSNKNSSPTKRQTSTTKDSHATSSFHIAVPKQPPFCCGFCKSPYVSDPMKSKRGCRTKKSRHNPSPKIHFDPTTGNRIEICNACAALLNPVRIPEPRPQLSAEEKQTMLNEAKQFAFRLAQDLHNCDAERLYCAHFKSTTICGCLQAYLVEDRDEKARELLSMMEEARNLSRLKSYLPTNEKKQRVGLGNGQKRAKEFEDYILEKRSYIRQELKLCETACKQVLLYSNNFLHKHMKTESRRRMKRTKCKGKLNILPEIKSLPDKTCCIDMCVQMALSHYYLLCEWRERAQTCQVEARRVLAEMLTPSGGSAKNCYKFIHWVTGCSNSTIQKVNQQMKATRGNREPPRHGLRKNWEVENHIGSQQEHDTGLNVQTLENPENYIIVPVSAPSSSVPQDSPGEQLSNIQKQILDQFVTIQQQQKQVSQQIMQKSTSQSSLEARNVQYLIEQLNTLQQTVEQISLSKGHGVTDNQPISTHHLHSNQGHAQQMASNSQYMSSISSSPRVSASSSPSISIGPSDKVNDQSAASRQISLLTGKVVQKQLQFQSHNLATTSKHVTVFDKHPQKSIRQNQRGVTQKPSATISSTGHQGILSPNSTEKTMLEPRNDIDAPQATPIQKSTKRRHKSHPAPSKRIEPVAQRSASTSVEMMSQPIIQINQYNAQKPQEIQVPLTNQISVVNQLPQIPLSNTVPAFVGEDGILNFITPMPVAYNIQAYPAVAQKITDGSGGIQILQPISNQVSSQNGRNEQSFIIAPPPANQIVTMPTQAGQQTVVYQLPPGFQSISIPQGQQLSEAQPQQFQIIQPGQQQIEVQGQIQPIQVQSQQLQLQVQGQHFQVQGQQPIQVQGQQPIQVQGHVQPIQGQHMIQVESPQQVQNQGQKQLQVQGQQLFQVQGHQQVKVPQAQSQLENHKRHKPHVVQHQPGSIPHSHILENFQNDVVHHMEGQGLHLADQYQDHHQVLLQQHEQHPPPANHHDVLNPQISEPLIGNGNSYQHTLEQSGHLPSLDQDGYQQQISTAEMNKHGVPLNDHFQILINPDNSELASDGSKGSEDNNFDPDIPSSLTQSADPSRPPPIGSNTTQKGGSTSGPSKVSTNENTQDSMDDHDSAVLKEMTTEEILKANAAVSDSLVGKSRSIRVTTISGREEFDEARNPSTSVSADLSHDANLDQSNVKDLNPKQAKSKPVKKVAKRKRKAKPKTPKKKAKTRKVSASPTVALTHTRTNEFESASEIQNSNFSDMNNVAINRVKVTAEQPLKIRHKSGNKTFAPSFDLDPNLNMTSSNHVYSSSHNVLSAVTSSSNSAPPSRSSLANTPTSQLLANPNLPFFMSSPDYEHALSIMNSDPDLTNMRNWNYGGETTPPDPNFLSLSSSDILQILSSHHDPKTT